MRGFIAPCLPTKALQPPSGERWLHEIKHDGFRVIARKDGRRVRLYRRRELALICQRWLEYPLPDRCQFDILRSGPPLVWGIASWRLGHHDRTDPQARANWVKSRGLCVMPHWTRIFFIAFALAAASCSGDRAQKEAERKEMGRQLTATYYSCVRTSFASQLPTMVDRNMAIDQAFMVCRTEESKLQAFENTLSENPNVSNAAISAHRNSLKQELLRR
jgi:hypothetical protein